MPTADDIRRQIENLPDKYIFYTKREINYLPQILVEGEEIRALTSGFSNNRTVLAVVTNRRVLFLDKGMFFGLRQWQMALDRVQSIDGNYLIFFGGIRIWDGATAIKLSMVLAKSIDPFIKATRTAIDEFKRLSFRETVGAASSALDVASQIERLAALKAQGHLTEEEFQSQKKKILAHG
ncbi:MAG: PH domain-containing protein [Rickettsiales bacterium]|nr:PH domain-containing protein [Rickettsiales bacterium]